MLTRGGTNSKVQVNSYRVAGLPLPPYPFKAKCIHPRPTVRDETGRGRKLAAVRRQANERWLMGYKYFCLDGSAVTSRE
jgi:hypothetical protein